MRYASVIRLVIARKATVMVYLYLELLSHYCLGR